MTDNIKPDHYRKGEIDLFENWYRTYPFNEYRAIMQAHAEKYLRRVKNDRVEDLGKAIYTLERLKEKEIEHAEKFEDKEKSQVELFHEYRKEYLERLWFEGYRYLFRDIDDSMGAHKERPEKKGGFWKAESNYFPIDEEHDFFPEIQWSDEEPTKISELLASYENGGENGKWVM